MYGSISRTRQGLEEQSNQLKPHLETSTEIFARTDPASPDENLASTQHYQVRLHEMKAHNSHDENHFLLTPIYKLDVSTIEFSRDNLLSVLAVGNSSI